MVTNGKPLSFPIADHPRMTVWTWSPQHHFPGIGTLYRGLSASVTGLHCAEAIFHLPELLTNTTVVASCEFSLADLVVRMPVRTAVSPNRRTDTLLNSRSVFESRFDCSPALAVAFATAWTDRRFP
jgi:hypothetical protein